MKRICLFLLTILMVSFVSVGFVSCNLFEDDDDDNEEIGPSPTETGWSGNIDDGVSYYRPELTNVELGASTYYTFNAENGVCQSGTLVVEFKDADAAEAFMYMLEDDDDEDDYEAKSITLNPHMQKRLKLAKGMTRAGASYQKDGKNLLFPLGIHDMPMQTVGQLMSCWELMVQYENKDFEYGYVSADDPSKMYQIQEEQAAIFEKIVDVLPGKCIFGTYDQQKAYYVADNLLTNSVWSARGVSSYNCQYLFKNDKCRGNVTTWIFPTRSDASDFYDEDYDVYDNEQRERGCSYVLDGTKVIDTFIYKDDEINETREDIELVARYGDIRSNMPFVYQLLIYSHLYGFDVKR